MKHCLFSVSYAGLWGQHQLDLCSFIAKAAKLGFDGVMLAGKRPHLSPLDVREESLEAVQSALRENNISCEVIAAYTDLSPTAASEVPLMEMQIAYVEQLCQLAGDLGAPLVRVFTAYESDQYGGHRLWTDVVRAIQEMCDRALSSGVTIVIQNHHDLAVDSDALLELFHDIDRSNCGLGFDAWSPALRGEDLYEAAKKMAPFAKMTTNADYVRLPRYRYHPGEINYQRANPDLVRAVGFGEGFIDYEAFFQGMKDGGFEGTANYEMCSPVRGGGSEENLDTFSRKYLQWMNERGYGYS